MAQIRTEDHTEKMNGKWDTNNEILAIPLWFSKGLNRFSHDSTLIYTDDLVLFIDSII